MRKTLVNTVLVMIFVVFGAGSSLADGFVCQTHDDDLIVKVFNHVHPEDGTRNAAVMILSDPDVNVPNSTIARFFSGTTLENDSTVYTAKVDLRYRDSRRRGEYIGGTRLGYLKRIVLAVDFSYLLPVGDGDLTDGMLYLEKRNGDVIEKSVECERYLKTER